MCVRAFGVVVRQGLLFKSRSEPSRSPGQIVFYTSLCLIDRCGGARFVRSMRPQTSAALLLIAATIAVVLAGETGDAAAGTSLAPQIKLDARRRGKAGVDVYIWIAPGVNVAGFQFELLFDRNGAGREKDVLRTC